MVSNAIAIGKLCDEIVPSDIKYRNEYHVGIYLWCDLHVLFRSQWQSSFISRNIPTGDINASVLYSECRWLNMHTHDDVIKWKHFPRYWSFVRGIQRSPVNSPHKGQWRGALMFTLICARINAWVNNREAGDLRRYRTHSDVIVMGLLLLWFHIGRFYSTCRLLIKMCYW